MTRGYELGIVTPFLWEWLSVSLEPGGKKEDAQYFLSWRKLGLLNFWPAPSPNSSVSLRGFMCQAGIMLAAPFLWSIWKITQVAGLFCHLDDTCIYSGSHFGDETSLIVEVGLQSVFSFEISRSLLCHSRIRVGYCNTIPLRMIVSISWAGRQERGRTILFVVKEVGLA